MNKNKQTLFFLAITVILMTAIILFLFFKNSGNKKIIFETKDALEHVDNLPTEQELKNKINEILQKKEKISSYLLNKSNPIDFIEYIESDIVKNKLKGSINRTEYTKDGGDLILEIVTEGSFDNSLIFLNDLEQSEKEVSVESIRFSKNESSKNSTWVMFIGLIVKTK